MKAIPFLRNAIATALVSCSAGILVAQPQASLTLSGANAVLLNVENTSWALTKTGLFDPDSAGSNTGLVVWELTATKGATTASGFSVYGFLTVTNTGSAPAPVGNIVVNLQRIPAGKGAKWTTEASNVANATAGDAATTANVVPAASSEGLGMFSENGNSGALNLTDPDGNTAFAIQGGYSIPPGASVPLYFHATFNVTIPVGELVRIETIVSFSNVNPRGGGATASGIDITGDGIADGNVRSVPTRITLAVPALTSANSTVVVDELGATSNGTVTFTSAFDDDMGGTGEDTISATKTWYPNIDVDGGADGGEAINNAALTGAAVEITLNSQTFTIVPAADIQVESRVTIPGLSTPPPPPPPNHFLPNGGSCTTYSQGGYGGSGAPGTLLSDNWTARFPSGLVVGSGTTVTFSSAAQVKNYLPAGGTPSRFTVTAGPTPAVTTTSAGSFGGQLTALKINLALSPVLNGNTTFASLRIANLTGALGTAFNGQTIAQAVAIMDGIIGGGSLSGMTYSEVSGLAEALNLSYHEGTPSSWAVAHLVP